MALEVYERQQTEQWYVLSGYIEAREVFPTLLPNSESVVEIEDDEGEIETEHEFNEGGYDGCPQELEQMEDEVAEFTKSALMEFHDEALAAAKAMLTALKAGETLLRANFDEDGREEVILEEAATALGVVVPWDPVEAAEIAAAEVAHQAALQRQREQAELDAIQAELRAKETAEVLEKARELFKAGNSHAAVRAAFPQFATQIASLVGELRKQGMQIARF
jgi:hypothetical protein